MPFSRYVARSAILNWMALFCIVGISFFFSPFLVSHLGNESYGVWTLVNTIIAYVGLLDFGLRGAVTRFVGWDFAQGNHDEACRTISTTLWIRSWLGCAVVVLCAVLGYFSPRMFSLPVDLHTTARWTLVITGISAAISFVCGVFGGVLAALQRQDLASSITIGHVIIRTLNAVWLLKSGYGLIALAASELVCALLTNSIQCYLCFQTYPQLRIIWGRIEKSVLARIWEFSLYVCIFSLSAQVIYYTDTLVIGAFLSMAEVTFYSIGGGLIGYTLRVVQSLTVTFTPLAVDMTARGQLDALRRLLLQGTRLAVLIGVPIQVTLMLRGDTFIRLWMGEEYVATSSSILRILLIAQFFQVANMSSYGVIFGLDKARAIAFVGITEAIVNLALSIVFVQRFGAEGVAWGTVIPNLVSQILFLPAYVCSLVNLSVWSYFWHAWARSYMSVVPFAVACYFVDHYWYPPNLLTFFLQMLTLIPIVFGGAIVCFPKETREIWQHRPAWLFPTVRSLPSIPEKS